MFLCSHWKCSLNIFLTFDIINILAFLHILSKWSYHTLGSSFRKGTMGKLKISTRSLGSIPFLISLIYFIYLSGLLVDNIYLLGSYILLIVPILKHYFLCLIWAIFHNIGSPFLEVGGHPTSLTKKHMASKIYWNVDACHYLPSSNVETISFLVLSWIPLWDGRYLSFLILIHVSKCLPKIGMSPKSSFPKRNDHETTFFYSKHYFKLGIQGIPPPS